jgi:hypothetical protein
MGFQENPDIDIGKRKSSSKVVNLLKRMDRYKEGILKFLFTTDRPGFSSFLVTFFFSFHKEKKKVTERFEMKEELKLK